MALAGYVQPFQPFLTNSDDPPLLHSFAAVARTYCHGRCAFSPSCAACHGKAVKLVRMERAQKPQQHMALLEPVSNPRVSLEPLSNPRFSTSNPSGAVMDEVDRRRLMLPWLVSDVQLRRIGMNSSVAVFEEAASEMDESVRQVSVEKLVDGLPVVASQTDTRISTPTPPVPIQKHESPRGNDYHVNTGYAIRSLREELPSMFYKDLNYEFYREDIVFRDPLNIFQGIQNYKLIFWALRFHGQIFFRAIWVDVLSVWQPSERVITVRWTVRGIPRVPWEAQGRFDGTSEYKLDKDGKIYEHKVDNIVISSPPKVKSVTVIDLARIAGVHTTPTPTYYYRLLLLLNSLVPFLEQFTWVRFYLAFESTVALLG